MMLFKSLRYVIYSYSMKINVKSLMFFRRKGINCQSLVINPCVIYTSLLTLYQTGMNFEFWKAGGLFGLRQKNCYKSKSLETWYNASLDIKSLILITSPKWWCHHSAKKQFLSYFQIFYLPKVNCFFKNVMT